YPKTASAQPDLTAVPLWVDLQGVPDHLFSHNGLTFFGDTIGHTVKFHPNTERCVRLDVARLLVVMNLEEPLPASINVRGSGEVISVSYPWLPPRCLGCQKWGHTDKTCSKNKHVKDKTEVAKENEKAAESTGTEGLQAGLVVITENSKPIDIENPVLEVALLATAATSAHESSTNDSEGKVKDTEVIVRDSVSGKVAEDIEVPEKEEPWLTIPQSSPSGKRNNGKSGRGTEIELPSTSSSSRFHLLSTELEEGEVEVEEEVEEDSSSSDEESSVESKAVMEKKKQIEKQKLGNNKRNQKSNPSVNIKLRVPRTRKQIMSPHGDTNVMISLFAWNTRGFNKMRKQTALRSWIQSAKPSFGCLIETRVREENSISILNSALPNWNFLTNYDHHRLGKIWVCWAGDVS
ncbi:hypothetical protein HID58_022774, partial [Brassica napus]